MRPEHCLRAPGTTFRTYSQNEGGARRGLCGSDVRVRVAWRGDASRGRIDGRFRVVVSSSLSAVGGRRFSRYVFGDGDHTDAFSSPRSTKCPVELRRETPKHCENDGHSNAQRNSRALVYVYPWNRAVAAFPGGLLIDRKITGTCACTCTCTCTCACTCTGTCT